MQQSQIDDLSCPSFNCYSSATPSSTAAATISNQLLQQQHASPFHDAGDDEFEFSINLQNQAPIGPISISSPGSSITGFPLFNRDLLSQNHVDRETVNEEEIETAITCSSSLEKLFINERQQSRLEQEQEHERLQLQSVSSSSSSESDESEGEAPGVFCCVWRHRNDKVIKIDGESSSIDPSGPSPLSKCKKSSSTGSGSKRWRIRDLLRRSNSDSHGKEPVVLLTRKKIEIAKQKQNSGETAIVAGKSKTSASPSIHEFFYVQQRAKREVVKRKSYLPYRQGLVGLFSNVNGKGGNSQF